MGKTTTIIRLLGPLVALFIAFLGQFESHYWLLGIGAWMMLWWLTETVHLGVTALLPLLLFPVLGLTDFAQVSAYYSHKYVYLFFGGFILALALEKTELHYRIALWILRRTGTGTKGLLAGFMLATGFLSMWISNTATSIMMLPIATSVLSVLPEHKKKLMERPLLISVAWAANIGGMATLIGTPPNLIFAGFLSDELGKPIGFVEWLPYGLTISLILGSLAYFILARGVTLEEDVAQRAGVNSWLKDQWKNLGSMNGPQKWTAVIFTATAFLWMLRPYLAGWMPFISWSDTAIALFSAVLLFSVVSNGKSILEWEDTRRMPWGILLLFGGGLALAGTLQQSYWFDAMGSELESLGDMPAWIWILLMALLGVFATEMLSNMALVSALLPMVYSLSLAAQMEFKILALPLVLGASCAFMLPMATPPNAIVFSTGKLSMSYMARRGLVLNLLSVLVLVLLALFLK